MAVLRKVDGETIITEKGDTLVTVDELAEQFGLSSRSIWNFKNKEGMPYIRFGQRVMFNKDECFEWAEKQGKPLPSKDKVYAYLLEERLKKTRETQAKNKEEKGEKKDD